MQGVSVKGVFTVFSSSFQKGWRK